MDHRNNGPGSYSDDRREGLGHITWEEVSTELGAFHLERARGANLSALCSIRCEGVGTAETLRLRRDRTVGNSHKLKHRKLVQGKTLLGVGRSDKWHRVPEGRHHLCSAYSKPDQQHDVFGSVLEYDG